MSTRSEPSVQDGSQDAACFQLKEVFDKSAEEPNFAQCWLTVICFMMNGLVLRIWRNWQTRYFEVVVE